MGRDEIMMFVFAGVIALVVLSGALGIHLWNRQIMQQHIDACNAGQPASCALLNRPVVVNHYGRKW